MRAMLVVFTDPVIGSEAAYNRWYTDEHLPDCLAVPGYIRATRYRAFASMGRSIAQEYLSLYELEVPDVEVLKRISDEHMRRIDSGAMRPPPPDTINSQSMRALYYTAPQSRHGRTDETPDSVFLVFSDPVSETQDIDYNQWYDDIHVPEICSLSAFNAATRYTTTSVNMLNRSWVSERRYLAVYEMHSSKESDFEAALANFTQPMPLTGKPMNISPALDHTKTGRWAGYRISQRRYQCEALQGLA